MDESPTELSAAQRAVVALYGCELVELVIASGLRDSIAVVVHPNDTLRRIALYLSAPLSEWTRHIKYLALYPDSPHEAGMWYGTTRISPRGYGKPIRS